MRKYQKKGLLNKICTKCSKPYTTRQSKSRFCSTECRREFWKKEKLGELEKLKNRLQRVIKTIERLKEE